MVDESFTAINNTLLIAATAIRGSGLREQCEHCLNMNWGFEHGALS
jgi:hypothetical protein